MSLRNLTPEQRFRQVRVKSRIMQQRAIRDWQAGKTEWLEGCHYEKCLAAEVARLCAALSNPPTQRTDDNGK